MIVSEKAIEICQANEAKRQGCEICPIKQECKSDIGGTDQSFKAWQSLVNEAAERVGSK